MSYKAKYIRNWDAEKLDAELGIFIPARPVTFWSFNRVKDAWYVLIGKYDALDWEDKK